MDPLDITPASAEDCAGIILVVDISECTPLLETLTDEEIVKLYRDNAKHGSDSSVEIVLLQILYDELTDRMGSEKGEQLIGEPWFQPRKQYDLCSGCQAEMDAGRGGQLTCWGRC